ncbi:MAG: transcription termination/antitermination protein NusG [Gemmatimonadota bacterium]|nr:MAG: transcription termination/antitermination protein NusG [Gemmatimonadota bacterium]
MAKRWYVVRVQSGKEEQVRDNLEKRVKMLGLDEEVARVLVPTEKITVMKGGKRRVTQKKIFPGYIMVEMDKGDDVWFAIKETPGIGDFVGAHGEPVAMEDHEVDKILGDIERQEEKPKLKIEFKKGDSVKIKEGPFENFDGQVEEVMPTKGMVRVIVTIFGRPTPVELEYWQVESI